MKVLNFGSLNLDYTYSVDHMVRPGETLASSKMQVFCGGKGLNQSAAMAKAGVQVFHAGLIGEDGQPLLDMCRESGVDTTYIRRGEGRGGHTIIQVDKNAQNCILLYGGTNRQITREFADEVLENFGEGDLLVLQNEINELDYIIDRAYERKMRIILNPSPYDSALDACDMTKISVFLLNEIEGEQMTGQKEPDNILAVMKERYPKAQTVLTRGYGDPPAGFPGGSRGHHGGRGYLYRLLCGGTSGGAAHGADPQTLRHGFRHLRFQAGSHRGGAYAG